MGKASKKVKRQFQKKAGEQQVKVCQGKELALEEAFREEDYAKVLELLAELITANDIKPEFMYKGAYSYFMLGDYDRAAQWVTNTLNYAPDDISIRILLARLCFIQNRHDDGLAVYDFLVEHYLTNMTQEQKGQIIDSSEYYVRREADKLRQKFPHLAEFLSVAQAKPAETAAASVPNGDGATEGSTTMSALQRLKAKLQAMQTKDTEQAPQDDAVMENSAVQAEKESLAGNNADKIADIESRSCSLREKVQLLNKFAAGCYMTDDYVSAAEFLTAALKIDTQDNQTLKNMALTQAALGNSDKAQAFAANIAETDFLLLRLLKDHKHG